jgi:hypothetical protein
VAVSETVIESRSTCISSQGLGDPTYFEKVGTGFSTGGIAATEPLGIGLIFATDKNGNPSRFISGLGYKGKTMSMKFKPVHGDVGFWWHKRIEYKKRGSRCQPCKKKTNVGRWTFIFSFHLSPQHVYFLHTPPYPYRRSGYFGLGLFLTQLPSFFFLLTR